MSLVKFEFGQHLSCPNLNWFFSSNLSLGNIHVLTIWMLQQFKLLKHNVFFSHNFGVCIILSFVTIWVLTPFDLCTHLNCHILKKNGIFFFAKWQAFFYTKSSKKILSQTFGQTFKKKYIYIFWQSKMVIYKQCNASILEKLSLSRLEGSANPSGKKQQTNKTLDYVSQLLGTCHFKDFLITSLLWKLQWFCPNEWWICIGKMSAINGAKNLYFMNRQMNKALPSFYMSITEFSSLFFGQKW